VFWCGARQHWVEPECTEDERQHHRINGILRPYPRHGRGGCWHKQQQLGFMQRQAGVRQAPITVLVELVVEAAKS
jgi:hypothetical protein